eukprot:Opistho-2@18300
MDQPQDANSDAATAQNAFATLVSHLLQQSQPPATQTPYASTPTDTAMPVRSDAQGAEAQKDDEQIYAVVDEAGRPLFMSKDPAEARAFEQRMQFLQSSGTRDSQASGQVDAERTQDDSAAVPPNLAALLSGLVGGRPAQTAAPLQQQQQQHVPVVLIDERGRPIVVDPSAAAMYGSGGRSQRSQQQQQQDQPRLNVDAMDVDRTDRSGSRSSSNADEEEDFGALLRALGAAKAHRMQHPTGDSHENESRERDQHAVVYVDASGRPIAVRPPPQRRNLNMMTRLPSLGKTEPAHMGMGMAGAGGIHANSGGVKSAGVDGGARMRHTVPAEHDEQLQRLLAHAFGFSEQGGMKGQRQGQGAPAAARTTGQSSSSSIEGVPDHLPIFTLSERGEPVLIRPPSIEMQHRFAQQQQQQQQHQHQRQECDSPSFVMMDSAGRPVFVTSSLSRGGSADADMSDAAAEHYASIASA